MMMTKLCRGAPPRIESGGGDSCVGRRTVYCWYTAVLFGCCIVRRTTCVKRLHGGWGTWGGSLFQKSSVFASRSDVSSCSYSTYCTVELAHQQHKTTKHETSKHC